MQGSYINIIFTIIIYFSYFGQNFIVNINESMSKSDGKHDAFWTHQPPQT